MPGSPLSHSPRLRCLPVLALSVVVGACATQPYAERSGIPDLICTVSEAAVPVGDCAAVPTLSAGVLRLSGEGTFELDARYEACYRVEKSRSHGTYRASTHENGVDLELLASGVDGGDPDARHLTRTIGLVNLDSDTLDARFTDTAAVIRSRGQMRRAAPSVPLTCLEE